MKKIVEMIVGSYNDRELKRIRPIADKVMALDEEMTKLTDEQLRAKTDEFKERLEKGETLDDILPEAFAVCREASWRVLGMKHFRVQVVGGIVLHQGRISEMKTGEGKTLVATLPAYLNALTGKGVHVITVNDYLATRDSEQMGQLYNFLGLSVGLITNDIEPENRKTQYDADITYGTNNEFGFDYLRDNMVIYKEEKVQREHNFCIVDEVDSILVDEARTPLIISGMGDKSTALYTIADKFASGLAKEEYNIDEKKKVITLTEVGISKAEKYFGLSNYADIDNMEIQHHVNQALKARYIMKNEIDYIVEDGEVMIVDEFTGRIMYGRRYSDGLHQAIEAKEGVKIQRESKTLATITFQNYFRMYKKLSGMTGTAKTEEKEFQDIYGLDVIVVPTNKPMIRKDYPDVVYKTEKAKFNAVSDEIEESYKKGQPVLVGTVSIENSEKISRLLKKRGVPHQVLNAKYHKQEAEIITQAGNKGMVTIATNMAGRGTDIKLGEGVPEIGGLKIVGTERHESRRIDNQLRGRSGRQGDNGESRFYLALEDELMVRFGSDRVKTLVEKLNMPEDEPLESNMLTKAIENAQKRVEGENFDSRKYVLQYDDVMNEQRKIIYAQRDKVLENENLKDNILSITKTLIDSTIDYFTLGLKNDEEIDLKNMLGRLEDVILPKGFLKEEDIKAKGITIRELKNMIWEYAEKAYSEKEQEIGEDTMREIERVIMLRVVDEKWMDHIDTMEHLKEGIGLRAYGQHDPVVEYKNEGFRMFNDMIDTIHEEVVKYLFHIQSENKVERVQVAQPVSTNIQDEDVKKKPVVNKDKIGRNDACPCGSGKKYKNCCGKNA